MLLKAIRAQCLGVTKVEARTKKMKIRILVTAGMIIAGIAGPCSAFETTTTTNWSATMALLSNAPAGTHRNPLVHTASCDVNNEDKQAYCMRACEDAYVSSSSEYNVTLEGRTGTRKACEVKCGC